MAELSLKMKTDKFEHEDLPGIKDLQPPEWADILPHIEFYVDSPICFPIKIEMDNRLAGIGNTILHDDTVWLAHIIVHPDYRNKGIGKHITRTLVDSIDQSKYKTIYLIATELGEPVYASIGFETETTYSFLKDGHTNFNIHSNIRKFIDGDSESIMEIDRRATGEGRYAFLADHISNAYVFEKNQQITGFYVPSLSDGMILSDTKEGGIELMKLRFQNHPVAMLPDDNREALVFLKQNNFNVFKTAKRMRLGKKRDWQPEMYYNRISGQVG